MKNKITAFLFLFVGLFFIKANAIAVFKVKDSKILLNLEGAKVAVGQQFSLIGEDGKSTGVFKIVSFKLNKALAKLVSGKVTGKEKVVAMAAPAVISKPVAPAVPPKPEGPRVPYQGSVLLGLASNTLAVRITNGVNAQDVDNTGNSVSLAVAVDRQYFQPWFRARALFSFDQFNAIGASTIAGCNNQTSRDCQTDIKYLGVGLYGKYVKEYSAFHLWAAGGLNLKMPVSKSSTALVESSLGATVSYGMTLGGDYVLESKNFVTTSVEKQIYIKSDTAETSTIFIRLGVGKEF